jgi:uncharacterized membrane protein
MVSNKLLPSSIESIQINVLADGLFLAFALIVTVTGIALLWNAFNSNKTDRGLLSGQTFIGLVIFTFGLFNFVATANNMINMINILNCSQFNITDNI